MRRHLTARILTAFDDGTLRRRAAHRAATHLAACPECRAALRRRREVREIAAHVTTPPAPDVFDRIRERVDAGESLILPDGGIRPAPPSRPRWIAALVAALVVTAGSATAAVVGGALSLDAILGRSSPRSVQGGGAESAGVDVLVSAAGLEIVLASDVGRDVRLVIRADGPGALTSVVGRGGGGGVRFLVGVDRVTVRDARSGTVEITVPRGAEGPVRLMWKDRMVGLVLEGTVRMPGRTPAVAMETTVGELDTMDFEVEP